MSNYTIWSLKDTRVDNLIPESLDYTRNGDRQYSFVPCPVFQGLTCRNKKIKMY